MPSLCLLLLAALAVCVSAVYARYLHASAYLNSSRTLYILGGTSSANIAVVRTVIFDVSGLNFTDQELGSNDLASVVGNPVGSTCVAPSATVGTDSSASGYNIVCLGGDNLQAHPYALDTTNRKSTYIVTTSLLGFSIFGATGAILSDSIYFYGGFYDNSNTASSILSNTTATPSAKLVRYGPFPTLGPGSDVTSTNLDILAQKPTLARGYHASATVSSGIVIAFGQSTNGTSLSDTFLIDSTSRIVLQSPTGQAPSARSGASAIALDSSRVLLFGGRSRNSGTGEFTYSNELWMLDTSKMPWRWEKVDVVGAPGPDRAFHTANLVGRFMVVYGGLTVSGADVEEIGFFDTVAFAWGPPKTDMFGPGVPPATTTGPGSTFLAGESGLPIPGDPGMPGGIVAAIVVSVIVAVTAMVVAVFMWVKYNKKKRQFQTLEMIQMHDAELPPPYENNNARNLPQQQSPPQQRYSFLSALFTPSAPSVASESHSHSSTSNSNHTGPSSEHQPPQTEDAFGLTLRTSSRSNSVPVHHHQQQRSSMISVGSEMSWVSDGMVFAAIGARPESGTSQRWLMENQQGLRNGVGSGSGDEGGVGVARVVATHKPLLDDEIAIREGELVDVIRFFDDGWALGRSKVTGQRGFFPMSLVRIVETKEGAGEAGRLLGGEESG